MFAPTLQGQRLVFSALLTMSVSIFSANSFAESEASALKGNVKSGAEIYNAVCKGCHTVSIAPTLRGVVGRTIASVEDFPNYTEGLKAKQPLTWTLENLDTFLIDPTGFAPGTLMIQTIDDPQKRADMIAFLKAMPPPRK